MLTLFQEPIQLVVQTRIAVPLSNLLIQSHIAVPLSNSLIQSHIADPCSGENLVQLFTDLMECGMELTSYLILVKVPGYLWFADYV